MIHTGVQQGDIQGRSSGAYRGIAGGAAGVKEGCIQAARVQEGCRQGASRDVETLYHSAVAFWFVKHIGGVVWSEPDLQSASAAADLPLISDN